MIEFMVLGGQRSATTWAANWLTTDKTFCLHDPLMSYKIPHLEALQFPGRRKGIACTASYLYPQWVIKQKARKVLLYRDPVEINERLDALGLPRVNVLEHNQRLETLIDAGIPVWDWQALFEVKTAVDIWKHLLPDIPFDLHRHHLLTGMNVQPQFNRLEFGKEAMGELVAKIKGSGLV